jgi:hypothetical protein
VNAGIWHNRFHICFHAHLTPKHARASHQILYLRRQPSGLATEDMNKKFGVSNIMLTNTYDRLKHGTFKWISDSEKRFLDMWIIRSDAQNYMVFGDPAAHLRIPAE